MISRIPKKHRHKYKKGLGWDEKLLHFAVKVVGSAALLFTCAIGMDIYRLFH